MVVFGVYGRFVFHVHHSQMDTVADQDYGHTPPTGWALSSVQVAAIVHL